MGEGIVLSRLLVLSTISFLIGYLNLGVFAYVLFFFPISLMFFNSISRSLLRRMIHRRIQNRVVSQTNPQTESAEFLNKIVAMLHKMYAVDLDQWFKNKLNGLLEEKKPSFLKSLRFKKLDLGGNPPILEAVSMITQNDKHFMQLDFVLSWDSKCQGTLAAKLLHFPRIPLSILVEDFIVIARFRLTGLLHTTSDFYFGPMSVSILDIPAFDMNLRTFGGVDLLNLPGIRSILREVICGGMLKENILFPQSIDFNLSYDIGTQDMLDAAHHVRSLKARELQYQNGSLLKEADWLSLFRLGLKTKKYKPGSIIAIDVGKGISRPLLCRVVKGEVRMEVWRHSAAYVVDTCLNHALEENSLLQELIPFDCDEEHFLDALVVHKFNPGDYFAEMTFVNPNVYNVPPASPVTTLVVFIASLETEVAVSAPSVVEEACSDVGFEERFYRLVAVGLSENLRAYMKRVTEASRGKKEGRTRSLSKKGNNTKRASIWKVRPPLSTRNDPIAGRRSSGPDATSLGLGSKLLDDEKGPMLRRNEPRLAVTPPVKEDIPSKSVFRRAASPIPGRKKRPLSGMDPKQASQRNSISSPEFDPHGDDKRLFSRKAVSSAIGNVSKRKDEVSELIRSQLAKSPTVQRSGHNPNHDTFKVYLKDSTGKYVYHRVPIEDITLEQCKQSLVDAFHSALLGEAPRFFTVPKKNSKVQLQVGNMTIRTGMTVMIEGSNASGKGFVVYRSKKFVWQPDRPQERDTATRFIIRMKGFLFF